MKLTRPPPPAAYAAFFRRLAIAARSRIPLKDALAIILKDTDVDAATSRMMIDVEARVRNGASLADALRQMPAPLPAETVALVRTAELDGKAASTYELLEYDFEHRARYRLALRAALTWPAVALIAFVLILALASIFVLPVFREFFESFGAVLPLPTRILFGATQIAGGVLWVLVAAVAVAIFLFRRYGMRLPVSARTDRWLVRMPVVGAYLGKAFALRLLATLLAIERGAPVPETLANLRASVDNRVLAARVAALEARLAAGDSLAQAVRQSLELPSSLRVSAELGERSGDLQAALEQAREGLEEEAARSLLHLEQATLVGAYALAGLLIGFTVIALYLPIFKMGSVI